MVDLTADVRGDFREIARRAREGAGGAHAEAGEGQKLRGAEEVGLGVGFGEEGACGHHGVGGIEEARGLEGGAVGGQCIVERIGGEVGGEGVGQAEVGGELGAVEGGAEDPQGDFGACAGNGADGGIGGGGGEVACEFDDVVGEGIFLHHVAAECAGGGHIGAGGATEAEVDPAGVEGGEGAELLGDDEGGMVGEHDAACADADGGGGGGDVGDHEGGGG